MADQRRADGVGEQLVVVDDQDPADADRPPCGVASGAMPARADVR
jgi:hypothetical protein